MVVVGVLDVVDVVVARIQGNAVGSFRRRVRSRSCLRLGLPLPLDRPRRLDCLTLALVVRTPLDLKRLDLRRSSALVLLRLLVVLVVDTCARGSPSSALCEGEREGERTSLRTRDALPGRRQRLDRVALGLLLLRLVRARHGAVEEATSCLGSGLGQSTRACGRVRLGVVKAFRPARPVRTTDGTGLLGGILRSDRVSLSGRHTAVKEADAPSAPLPPRSCSQTSSPC